MAASRNSTLSSRKRDSPRGSALARSPRAWALAGGVVCLGLALLRFDPWLFTGGDNAVYYALAKSLATGRGYASIYLPGAPPHILYPPGFPVLLVPFYWAFGGSLVAMKFAVLALGAVLLWGVWRLAGHDPAVPSWAAAAAVWAVGAYGVFQTYTLRLLSDLPYTAIAVVALAVLQRAAAGTADDGAAGRAAAPPRDRLDRLWLLGCALAVLAFWIRVPGVTLLGAIGAWALLSRQWRRAASAAAIFALGTLPWFLWSRLAAASGGATREYIGQVTGITEQEAPGAEILENARRAAVEYGSFQLPHLFWPFDPAPDPVRAAGLVLGLAAVVWGAWRAIRSRGRIAPWEMYVPATLAILPFWPWLGDRYFLTIAPMLWVWILVGLDDASRRIFRGPGPAIGVVGLVCGSLLAAQASQIPERVEGVRAWRSGDLLAGYDVFWRDYFEAALWMRTHVPEDAVVLARKPSLVWYWSRRPVAFDPFERWGEDQWPAIRAAGVTHVLLEPWAESHFEETFAAHREDLSVMFRTESGQAAVLAVAPARPGGE